jgi:hypothetical protein
VDAQMVVQSGAIEYAIEDLQGAVHVVARRSRWDVGLIGRTRAFVRGAAPDLVHTWGTMCSFYALPATGFGRTALVAGHVRDAPSRLSLLDKRRWHGKLSEPFAGGGGGQFARGAGGLWRARREGEGDLQRL